MNLTSPCCKGKRPLQQKCAQKCWNSR